MEWSERNSFSCVEPRRKHEKQCSLFNFLFFPHHSIFFTFRSTQDFLFYFFSTLFHMRKKKILVKLYFFDWVPHREREREKIIVKMFFVFIWKKKNPFKIYFFSLHSTQETFIFTMTFKKKKQPGQCPYALKFDAVYTLQAQLYKKREKSKSPRYLGDAVTTTDGRFHWVTLGTALLLKRHRLVDELAGRQLEGLW